MGTGSKLATGAAVTAGTVGALGTAAYGGQLGANAQKFVAGNVAKAANKAGEFMANKGINAGFQRERNYDEDMNRLGRLKTQRQLHTGVNELNSEIRKLGNELNNGTVAGNVTEGAGKLLDNPIAGTVGAFKGGSLGATIGSAFGPLGTVAGAVAGSVLDMIRFIQKEFWIGAALNAVGVAGTVGSLVQGHNQQKQEADLQRQQLKEQKRIAEEQAKQQKQLISAINNNTANNGGVGSILQKSFALGNTVKGVIGIAKDLQKQHNIVGKVGKMAISGAAMGGLAYGADKIIQHQEKKDGNVIENTPEQKKKNGRTLLTGAALATTAVLAHKGHLGKTAQNLSKSVVSGAKYVGKNIKNAYGTEIRENAIKSARSDAANTIREARRIGDPTKLAEGLAKSKQAKELAKKPLNYTKSNFAKDLVKEVASPMNLAFGAGIPLATYASQKKAEKDQQEATKTYSINIKAAGKGVLGFLNGGVTSKGVKSLGNTIAKHGAANNSSILQTTGKFLQNDKVAKLVPVAAIGTGATVAFAPWSLGEKAAKKVAGAVDKNAFAYENQQNKQIQ
ncbi:unnamed protein product [Cylicocyclus nassatus]|uniref:Uncharacterized protein n=1 Tax=Cylicocyclus nassatus TaxID=53992 RepID=A0AA36DR92_CYLNA|nr:unnamed protein product [Cylicocyclus nassatus]